MLVGKTKLNAEEKEQLRDKKLRIKDKFEQNNLGDFEVLYPLKRGQSQDDDILMDRYDFLLIKAKEIWEESIAGGGYKKKDVGDTAPSKPAIKPGSSQSNRRT